MRLLFPAFALTLLAYVCLLPYAAPTRANGAFQAISLGTLSYEHSPVIPSSMAVDINNHGQVVANASINTPFWTQGFLWQPTSPNALTGSVIPQATLFSDSSPRQLFDAINPAGLITARKYSNLQLFLPNTPNSTSGTVQSTTVYRPNAAGFAPRVESGSLYLADVAGNSTLLASGLGTNFGAFDINESSQIVGANVTLPTTFSLWTPDSPGSTSGTFTDLQMNFPQRGEYWAFVNSQGQVASTANPLYGAYANSVTAYLFRPDSPNSTTGSTVALDDLLNVPSIHVLDLNNVGQMLTDFYSEGNSTYLGNHLLTPNSSGGFDILRLDNLTIQLDGNTYATNFWLTALNDHNQLVGQARWTFDNGATFQYLATMLVVPEPATFLTLAAFAVVFIRRNSSRRSRNFRSSTSS
jgi:hypothetical protein